MKIAIAIASVGRPDILSQTVARLARQTRAPDRVLVVVAQAADLPPTLPPYAQPAFGPRGSCAQRNRAIDILSGECDILVFLDDDFLPTKDFTAGVETLFQTHPEVVAASGHLIADGFRSACVSIEDADRMILGYEIKPQPAPTLIDDGGTYGCNMAMRLAAAPHARFDENLPLYGWLEDSDYSWHFARAGRVVRAGHFAGVHLGVKSGRSSGLRLGYSQIANPVYLVNKGTMAAKNAYGMASKNVIANLVKSLNPEPYVDRRGRLKGNFLALVDLFRDDIDPKRILDL